MRLTIILAACLATLMSQASAQSLIDKGTLTLTLPSSPGQLTWRAKDFTIVELSAKAAGQEIGVRGKDATERLAFLGFLFRIKQPTPVTSASCRDDALKVDAKYGPSLKISASSDIASANGLPVTLVNYATKDHSGKTSYMVRGFVANGDICGDLEFYGTTPISYGDFDLKEIFSSFQLDTNYKPQFNDVFIYAQILYQHHMYKAAAPLFEQAVAMLPDDKPQEKMRRVATDQAGVAYGISGNIAEARAIFNSAIAKDPDYPLYYYNLACADAEENNLADAQIHLQQAFDRKANVIPGESLPDPTKDDSFLAHRNKKEFWSFVETLH